MSLDKIFKPKSIAVIGASNEKGSVGYALFSNVKKYKDRVYPVNIKRKSIQGVKAVKKVEDIKGNIDLVIIATPAFTVPSVVEECGKKKIKGIIIISAGFDEAGPEGKKLSENIKKLSEKYKIRIIGPNCLGIISPYIGLNASFAGQIATAGNIAFISQSGAICTAILDWSKENNIGFSSFVSMGSALDVGFDDLLDYFDKDKNTHAIMIYMENLHDAEKFLEISKKVSKKKPIIILKSGRSEAGRQAVKSHSGSITANDEVFDAAFRQAGIIRINSIDDMMACAKLINYRTSFQGKSIGIVTNAGGPGVVAVDELSRFDLQLAHLQEKIIKNLNKVLPPEWSKKNPIDIIGDAPPERFKSAIKICLEDNNIDALLVLLTPQAMTKAEDVAEYLVKIKSKKTILPCFMGYSLVAKAKQILAENNFPSFDNPEEALKSYSFLIKQKEIVQKIRKETIINLADNKTKLNQKIIEKAKKERRNVLNESEAKEFLKNYNIPVTKYYVVDSLSEAIKKSQKIGYPVVLKVLSNKIIHKTEVGTYELNLTTPKEVETAYKKIFKNARKKDKEAKETIVEEQVNKKHELIVGMKKDPIFGPVIIFGRGGIEVELYNDKSLRLPPLSEKQAMEMIKETKIYNILKGYRKDKGVDIKQLQKILVNFSNLIQDFEEIKEIDINPFMIDKDGGIAVDAKIILD